MAKFTTTTPLCTVIHELSLMSAMQHFFAFKCQTDCGISKVRLEGTLEDWVHLREKAEGLGQYELEWWTKGILWILDKIIGTYNGKNTEAENKEFWTHIFKYYYGGGSGVNPSIDGWIVNFIPYIDKKPSPLAKRTFDVVMKEFEEGDQGDVDSGSGSDDWFENIDLTQPGLDIEKFKKASKGINITPFEWTIGNKTHLMDFISGFAGATMLDDGFIKVQMGWAVGTR